MKKYFMLLIFFIHLLNQTSNSQWSMCGTIRTSSCETLSNIRCFVADSINLYIGANNVKCSTDNGMNWLSASIPGFDFDEVRSLKYHNKLIYAATTEGIFKTGNYEYGWSGINFGLPTKNILCLLFSNNTLYAGTYNNGLYQSTNFGSTWRPTSSDTNKNYFRCLAYYKNFLLAGTYDGLYKSSDDGNSWIKLTNGLVSKRCSSLLVIGRSIFAVLSDSGLFKSVDEGNTWTKLNRLNNSDEIIFSLLAYGNIIFAGTNNGIYMSKNDGETWTCINDNFLTNDLYEIEMITKDGFLFAGITPEIYVIRAPLTSFNINLDLSIIGSTIACKDTITKFSTKSEKDVSINWSIENGEIIGSSSDTVVNILWNSIGEKEVRLTKKNISSKESDSSIIIVQVVNKPDKPKITRIDNLLTSSSPICNQWYWNGKPIIKSTRNTYEMIYEGKYTVDVYFNDFRSEMSDTIDFKVTNYIEEIRNESFVISPNPASDYIEISGSSVIQSEAKVPCIRIIDILGMEFTTPSLHDTPPYQGGEIVRIDVSGLAPGVYFVRVGDVVRKFVKM